MRFLSMPLDRSIQAAGDLSPECEQMLQRSPRGNPPPNRGHLRSIVKNARQWFGRSKNDPSGSISATERAISGATEAPQGGVGCDRFVIEQAIDVRCREIRGTFEHLDQLAIAWIRTDRRTGVSSILGWSRTKQSARRSVQTCTAAARCVMHRYRDPGNLERVRERSRELVGAPELTLDSQHVARSR